MSDEPIIDHTKTRDKVGWRWLHRSGPLSFKGDVPPKNEGQVEFPDIENIRPEIIERRINYLLDVLGGKDLTVAPWNVLRDELEYIRFWKKYFETKIPSSDNQIPTA